MVCNRVLIHSSHRRDIELTRRCLTLSCRGLPETFLHRKGFFDMAGGASHLLSPDTLRWQIIGAGGLGEFMYAAFAW